MLSLNFKVLLHALLWLYVHQCFTFSIYQKFRTFWYQTCSIRMFKILITGATSYLYSSIFPCRFLENEICTLLEAYQFLMPESWNEFLYARLQTGRIMVWWCPSVRPSVHPSVRPSQFSALFSYMLWHIDLKFCVSLYFYARKIKFECHQFPSLFCRSYAPF